jgi:hypothetical protein
MIKVEFEGKQAQISEDLQVTGDGVLVAELETEVTLAEATETEVTPFLALYYNLKKRRAWLHGYDRPRNFARIRARRGFNILNKRKPLKRRFLFVFLVGKKINLSLTKKINKISNN